MSGPLDLLLERWRGEVQVLNRLGHTREAEVLEERIRAVRDAARRAESDDGDWISTEEAITWSRMTRDHLQELAREGEVQARKERGRWVFLRASLPRKADPDPRPGKEGERPSERAARKVFGRS